MTEYQIAVLAGDGIGPEVMTEALHVLRRRAGKICRSGSICTTLWSAGRPSTSGATRCRQDTLETLRTSRRHPLRQRRRTEMGIAAARAATRTRRAVAAAQALRTVRQPASVGVLPRADPRLAAAARHRGGWFRRAVRARIDRRPVLRPAQVHGPRRRRSGGRRHDGLPAQRDRARGAAGVRGGAHAPTAARVAWTRPTCSKTACSGGAR